MYSLDWWVERKRLFSWGFFDVCAINLSNISFGFSIYREDGFDSQPIAGINF